MKLRLGRQIESPALSGDGVLTTAAAALAAVTLLALAANSILDWWWADPVAALMIAAALAYGGDTGRRSTSLRVAVFRDPSPVTRKHLFSGKPFHRRDAEGT